MLMQPGLVCKVVVCKKNGKSHRVSGYPITPNRIITVAHDVADAAFCESFSEDALEKDQPRHIRLSFGVREEMIDAPVFIEWCGKAAKADVVILKCELPPQFHPAHRVQ